MEKWYYIVRKGEKLSILTEFRPLPKAVTEVIKCIAGPYFSYEEAQRVLDIFSKKDNG